MAKDAYWFRHDANARNDIKVIELRSLHGYQGYGIYFATLEVMREQTLYCIPENKIGMLGVALGESPDKVREIINDCVMVGLFEREDGLIFSRSFLERMSKWETVKTRNETNGGKGGRPKKNPSDNPNETQNKPRRGEERIEEDRIEENKEKTVQRKRFTPPSFEQVYSIMLNRRETELFISYYESNGWKVGKNPMKDWARAVTGWKLRGNVQDDSARAQYENYGDSIG
jgi:hypothetical protein